MVHQPNGIVAEALREPGAFEELFKILADLGGEETETRHGRTVAGSALVATDGRRFGQLDFARCRISRAHRCRAWPPARSPQRSGQDLSIQSATGTGIPGITDAMGGAGSCIARAKVCTAEFMSCSVAFCSLTARSRVPVS